MTFDLNICEYTYPFGGESSWVILNCRNTHLEVHAQPKHTGCLKPLIRPRSEGLRDAV